MKSKSQLVREFINQLGKRVCSLSVRGRLFLVETSDSLIYGHLAGDNIVIDNEWEK